jgi:DNA-binding NarL/FixJ family response regulator
MRWVLSETGSFDVIGEAGTNIETLESILKVPVDMLILNTNHDKPSGIDVTRYVSHKLPDIKVILIMDEYSTKHVVEAIKSGAKACVGKSIDLDSLVLTVNQVIHDEMPISHHLLEPKVADYILKEYEGLTKITPEASKPYIRLVQSEQMILKRIRDDIAPVDPPNSLGISREVLREYLDEIVEKLVKIEYFNETPEQTYISNLVSRNFSDTSAERYDNPDEKNVDLYTAGSKSVIPEDVPQNSDAWPVKEESQIKNINKQSVEFDEPVKDISEVVELARKAGRLTSMQVLNQYIVQVNESLITEIEHRRRVLHRTKKAIESEIASVQDSDITWN